MCYCLRFSWVSHLRMRSRCQMEERHPPDKVNVTGQSDDMRDNGAQEDTGEAKKQRATLSQDRQLPANVTFTGSGSVGG
jgi:hypothetical protein